MMNATMRDAWQLPAPVEAPVELSVRLRAEPPYVKISDPALRVMNDFTHEAPWTIGADQRLDEVLDEMFRHGVRAFLVARQQQVIGLITSDDIRGERLARFHPTFGLSNWSDALCVADVMTDASDIPAIDWQTVLEATVSDLLEIFEGTGVNHLVVVETDSGTPTRVRGLIHRSRLDRQLGVLAHP